MKKLTSSAAILLLAACAYDTPVKDGEASLPQTSPPPVEQVDQVDEKDAPDVRNRARRLLEIILGGVNR